MIQELIFIFAVSKIKAAKIKTASLLRIDSYMMQPFKKASIPLMAAALSLIISPSSMAHLPATYANLPSIGTAAAGTLTIDKEIEYGHAYMQMLRASQPLVLDPLLTEYVNSLGATLIANATDVKTPFEFFLVENKDINAFAFFGGYIGLHTGLFYHAQNESELASVVAHEIAHLTQRHLARAMEDQAKKTPFTVAALVGSLMLAIASPQAGIAAAQATTAASIQGQINYTRQNEKEADRIGIETLNRAGFDVHAMPAFFTRLSDQYRYVSKPPAFLLTHPLPDERITDTRQRAQQYPSIKTPPLSQNFMLAKARVIARFLNFKSADSLAWFERAAKNKKDMPEMAINYGKALVYIDTRKFKQANALLTPLLKAEPYNRFYLDAATDLSLAQEQYSAAITRLKKALKSQTDNPVLLINLYYAKIKAGAYKEAISGLLRYSHRYPKDLNAWRLLQEAYEKSGNRHATLAAQGEILALKGAWDRAILLYTQASQLVKLGSLDQARYDARIDQLQKSKMRTESLKR